MKCMIEYVRIILHSEYIAAADDLQEYRKHRSIPDGKVRNMAKYTLLKTAKKCVLCRHWNGAMGKYNDPDENEGVFPSGNDRKADLLPDCKNDTGVELLFQV